MDEEDLAKTLLDMERKKNCLIKDLEYSCTVITPDEFSKLITLVEADAVRAHNTAFGGCFMD